MATVRLISGRVVEDVRLTDVRFVGEEGSRSATAHIEGKTYSVYNSIVDGPDPVWYEQIDEATYKMLRTPDLTLPQFVEGSITEKGAITVQNTTKEQKIYFRSEEHRERYREALSQTQDKSIYDGNRIDQYYGPALLLLTLDGGFWTQAQRFFTRNGFDFETYLEKTYFSTTERTVAMAAAHLFNESYQSPSLTDLAPLDDRNFEVVMQAIRMRRSPYQLADIEP